VGGKEKQEKGKNTVDRTKGEGSLAGFELARQTENQI
jgi:hypothetical protein